MYGIATICICAGTPPECLNPALKNSALSEMLVKVAEKDKHYIGCEVPIHSPDVSEHTPEKAASQMVTTTEKKAPMTLSLADSRMFAIDNGKVIKDGGHSSTGGAMAQMGDPSGLVSKVLLLSCIYRKIKFLALALLKELLLDKIFR